MAMGLWHPSIHTKLRATVGRHHNRCQPPSYEVVLLPGHWRPGEQLPDQCGRVPLRVHEGSRRCLGRPNAQASPSLIYTSTQTNVGGAAQHLRVRSFLVLLKMGGCALGQPRSAHPGLPAAQPPPCTQPYTRRHLPSRALCAPPTHPPTQSPTTARSMSVARRSSACWGVRSPCLPSLRCRCARASYLPASCCTGRLVSSPQLAARSPACAAGSWQVLVRWRQDGSGAAGHRDDP